jgi:hypothetical protein
MQNFVTKSGPGLLAIAIVAGLGYFVLTPPLAPAVQADPADIAFHSAACAVCQLPLFGEGAQSSRFGPDSHSHRGATESTQ